MLEGTGSKPCSVLSALSIRLSGLLKNGRRGHSTQRTEHRARLACAVFESLASEWMPKGSGGARRDRTADPLLAKQVLSQLSYGPVINAVMSF